MAVYVYPAATSGESTTVTNLGTGNGLYVNTVGTDLRFKSLTAGTNITLTPSGTELQISASGSSGANTSLSNLTAPTAVNESLTMAATKTIILPNNTSLQIKNSSGVAQNVLNIDGTDNINLQGNGSLLQLYSDGIYLGNTTYIQTYETASELELLVDSGISIYLSGQVANIYGTGAAPTLALYDASNTNYIGLKSPAAPAASVTFTLPTADGTSGQVLSTDGSGNLSFITAAGGANTTLSNLTTTIAIPNGVHLLPAAASAVNLGSSARPFGDSYLRASYYRNTSSLATTGIVFAENTNTPSGVQTTFQVNGAGSGGMVIYTENNSTANATATGTVFIESGNKLAGTGNSGDINITTGTSSGGTRGDLTVNVVKADFSATTDGLIMPSMTADPSAPADGTIWYRTDTDELKVRINGTTKVITAV